MTTSTEQESRAGQGRRARYGTSSWTARGWDGAFYPRGLPAGEQLGFYATQFDTVEADVTYYRVPDARLAGGWERKTPEGFRLSAKFPRSIVHGGAAERPDASKVLVPEAVWGDVERFLESMSLLGAKCGPLVLQFPYFNRSAFEGPEAFLGRLERFLERLPESFRYAVEVRNRAWIGERLIGVLRRRRCALVWVDIAYMPHPCELGSVEELVTTDFVYARLIGDRKKVEAVTTTFDRVVIDCRPRLERWAGMLREALERVPEVYVYANNHYAGFAPATIRELEGLVRGGVG